jgi:spermidine synthase
MNDRLNDGGIATFWLPIYQLSVEETKSILRAFHNAFPNTLVWAGPDEEWIMMGIKGPPQKIDNAQLQRPWRDSDTKSDLARIGIETPEQLAAMFLLDGDEIDRISNETKPLTDLYPKRLGDNTAEDPAIHDFAMNYVRSKSAAERFRLSPLIQQIWQDTTSTALDPFFVIREMRYRARFENRNWLADLDIHLRGSSLREPVLETLGSNLFRVALAQKVADDLHSHPVETLSDLVAIALAQRDYTHAVQLLEEKRTSNAATGDDILLLTYLYCLNRDVSKAEAVAAAIPDRHHPLARWLWEKLEREYGFRPPD